jgi:hypothetical protein
MKCASTASKSQWPCEVAKPGQAERAPVVQAKPRLPKERTVITRRSISQEKNLERWARDTRAVESLGPARRDSRP